MTQGPDGFLWLGATDGVYRFDGFHYFKLPGYPFREARHVAFTREGTLWVASPEGLARYRSQFEIVWKGTVVGFGAFADYLLLTNSKEIRRVNSDGSMELILPRGGIPVSLTVDSKGRAWSPCISGTSACWIDPKMPGDFHRIAVAPLPGAEQAIMDRQDRVWIADAESAQYAVNGSAPLVLSRRITQKVPRHGPLLPGNNGQVWFLGEQVRGLSPEVEFLDRQRRWDLAPTAGLEDDRSHLWVATLGEGLTEWIPDADWERWFPENFAGLPAAQVVRASEGDVVAATRNNLYRLDPKSRTWSAVSRKQRNYASVLPLPGGDFLASVRMEGLLRLSAAGEVVERIATPVGSPDDTRLVFQTPDGIIWVADRSSLLRIEGQPGKLRARQEPLPMIEPPIRERVYRNQRFNEQAIDLEVDREGKLWVGFADGIAWRDKQGSWHRLPTDEMVRDVRSFTLAGDRSGDEIWVALRGQEMFLHLLKTGAQWKVTHFAPESGYAPPGTHFIKRDSRGWIWRGSTDGVYISDGRDVGPNDWIHIGMNTGLATNSTDQYGFFEDADGSVWISGEDGISHLHPSPEWFDPQTGLPGPKITRVSAGKSTFWDPNKLPESLPESAEEVHVDVGSLVAPPFRDAPFRYRLKPLDSAWRLSRDGSLVFRNLRSGKYSLEVGYTGTAPSTSVTYSFQVGTGLTGTWIWFLPFPVTGLLWALWKFGWLSDRAQYRLSKLWFVLRRRFFRGGVSSSPSSTEPARDFSGETFLGRYELIHPIARSGFSVVYDAIDRADKDRRLAVKVLNASTGTSGWVRDRFAHEVTALQSLRHPGVVRILDSWIGPNGEPCLAMPFLEGPTLRAAMQEEPFPPPRVADVTRLLGSALAAAHARGVVHRDLKPENIILTSTPEQTEQPVLIDFGTAGLIGAESGLATTTLLAGSFYYMAPERLSGHYSSATDVYALGIIVLEMLTGKRLADLSVMFGDSSFLIALADAVAPSVGQPLAQRLAESLAAAYDPSPQNRPTAEAWAEGIARVLESGTNSTGS